MVLDRWALGLLGIWAGAILYFSFAATPRLFRALGREQAGAVVSLLFGGYYLFGWMAGGLAVLLLGLLGWPMPRSALAGAALALALLQGTAVRRWVVALRDARAALAADGARQGAAEKRFQVVHGVSMLLNLVVLGLVLAAILA